MKNIVTILLILWAVGATAQENNGVTIEIEITNIESSEGKILVGLYDSDDNWLKKPFKAVSVKIENGKSKARFDDVPKGVYAVSLYHDENDNGELDTNFLGIPKEDTGASNNAPANFGPPTWEDAKFEITEKIKKQTIKL
ncbi:DUF2141 domain-containing protein [Maribacter halichondriae]|uniref:DUF2141 domain-containing protein n=1 Tax=Maribacter halichondriae TaxID=2980554 RepID=UPI0023596A72|nr:DUF2141 domain-containing protein [Maribacter sp. Hal144]